MTENNPPMVSVSMITYKHDAYIKEAIEGVLMQETTFEFDLIIADDCSPDYTSDVINEIIKTHPKGFRIKYFRHDTNIGMEANGQFATSKCLGRYLAICEGDDYWTDPLKLQKQVDFLEANPDYVYCTHRYQIYNQITGLFNDVLQPSGFKSNNAKFKGVVVDTVNCHKDWYTQPLTALIRRAFLDEVEKLKNNFSKFRDHHIFYLLLNYGKGLCMEFDGGVYRVHEGGIYSGIDVKERILTSLDIYEELYFFSKDMGFLKVHSSTSLYMLLKRTMKYTEIQSFFFNLTFKEKIYYLFSFLTGFVSMVRIKAVRVCKLDSTV